MAASPIQRKNVRVQYKGPKDADGQPHGVGIMLTELCLYKGQFAAGKFHGKGVLRWFAPSAAGSMSSPSRPGSAAASPSNRPRQVPGGGTTPRPALRPGSATARGGAPSPSSPAQRVPVWTYAGSFWEGKKHGVGKIVFHGTNESYEGQWVHNEMRGNGVYVQDTGVYSGEFVANKRHGLGTMIYINQSGYRGYWHSDVYHGSGRLVEQDGTYFDGHWNRGQMNGIVHMTKPSGSVYRRQYLDGRKVADEKRKERTWYDKLFEEAPKKFTTAERLAQVFQRRPAQQQASPQNANNSSTDASPNARRPVSADAFSRSTGERPPALDDVDDIDLLDDDDDAMDDEERAVLAKTPNHLTRSKSNVQSMAELGSLKPQMSMRDVKRPVSADMRPDSAGSEDAASPRNTVARAGARTRANELLAQHGVASPASDSLDNTVGSLPNLSPEAVSEQLKGEQKERFAKLLAEQKALGEAPLPPSAADSGLMPAMNESLCMPPNASFASSHAAAQLDANGDPVPNEDTYRELRRQRTAGGGGNALDASPEAVFARTMSLHQSKTPRAGGGTTPSASPRPAGTSHRRQPSHPTSDHESPRDGRPLAGSVSPRTQQELDQAEELVRELNDTSRAPSLLMRLDNTSFAQLVDHTLLSPTASDGVASPQQSFARAMSMRNAPELLLPAALRDASMGTPARSARRGTLGPTTPPTGQAVDATSVGSHPSPMTSPDAPPPLPPQPKVPELPPTDALLKKLETLKSPGAGSVNGQAGCDPPDISFVSSDGNIEGAFSGDYAAATATTPPGGDHTQPVPETPSSASMRVQRTQTSQLLAAKAAATPKHGRRSDATSVPDQRQ